MSAATALVSGEKISPEEYLRREHLSESKQEYLNGEILAMSGGTFEHSHIGANLMYALNLALRDEDCDVVTSYLKVCVAPEGPYFYPDVTVVCGTPDLFEGNCLRNPIIIFEVLSPSTRAFDRDQKFRAYRRIPSLRHCLLVATDEIHVEHYDRLANGLWTLAGEHKYLTDTMTFSEPAFSVAVAAIYWRVQFDTAEGLNL